jgi:hypothetical protein
MPQYMRNEYGKKMPKLGTITVEYSLNQFCESDQQVVGTKFGQLFYRHGDVFISVARSLDAVRSSSDHR